MSHVPALAGLLLALAGCYRDAPAPGAPANIAPTPTAVRADAVVPSVAVVSEAEWEACEASDKPTIDLGLGGEPFYCEGQSLEGGAPLRYHQLPAVTTDGSLIAVVEERDGWGHVSPGIRFLDREGKSVSWFPLDGTRATVDSKVAKANAALREHAWIPLSRPLPTQVPIDPDHVRATLTIGTYTATYERTNQGDYWLPPSRITVRDAQGRELVSRTDTERAWLSLPRCNLPHFVFFAANASPGVLLFKTELGMGGHNCDGVEQPPAWHVLTFPAR